MRGIRQKRRAGRTAGSCAMALALCLHLLMMALAAAPALAHEPTIATLDLAEVSPGVFLARWGDPTAAKQILPLFPPQCLFDPPRLDCGKDGLNGTIEFAGAGAQLSAMLLRVKPLSGAMQTAMLTANQRSAAIRTTPRVSWRDFLDLAASYVQLGIQHILLGPDHLLFVGGLIWIVMETAGQHGGRWFWRLLKTISAFTLAHSLTLAAATLGVVSPPVVWVNAMVALSILFLAPEMLRAARGQTSLSLRRPHLVAFCFGLLHGFGFSSALSHAGLAGGDLLWALLGFNLGVEIGQLLFIMALGLCLRAARLIDLAPPALLRPWPIYAVGSLGAFWTIGRVLVLGGIRV